MKVFREMAVDVSKVVTFPFNLSTTLTPVYFSPINSLT